MGKNGDTGWEVFRDANLEKIEGEADRVDLEDALCDNRGMGDRVRKMAYRDLVRAYYGHVRDLPENCLVAGWRNPWRALIRLVEAWPDIRSAELAVIFDVKEYQARAAKAWATMRNGGPATLAELEGASMQDEEAAYF